MSEKFGGKEKSSTFAVPFETRVAAAGEPGDRKAKKTSKKFCGIKKVSTFATPIEKGVWKSGPEGSKYRKRSLKRLKESTRKQVPKQNERERQFLRETNRQVKLREREIYKEEFDPGSG